MSSGNSVAVLVRSHIANLKTAHLLHALAAGWNYDLYVCANETNGPRSFPPYRTLGHTNRDFERLGCDMTNPFSILSYSDTLFSIVQDKIPGYRHYLMIEFDVQFVRPAYLYVQEFVERLNAIAEPVDMVAAYVRPAWKDWVWYDDCHRLFPEVYASFFPFVCLSDRAIPQLLESRRREWRVSAVGAAPIYCEAFTPSALHESGFSLLDINALMPGSCDVGSFNTAMPEALRFGAFEAQPVLMVHPVKDCSDGVADPALRARVAAFEGQQRRLPLDEAGPIAMRAGALLRRRLAGDLSADSEFDQLLLDAASR